MDSPLETPSFNPQLDFIREAFKDYDTVLRPDTQEAEWWAGAPSVVRDDDGVFWMACRMRTAEGTRGWRGYEVRILRSEDGVNFEAAQRIRRELVPIPGFERPALLRDPHTGKFKLYGCGPWQDGPWNIVKWPDADRPDQFELDQAKAVIGPMPKRYDRDIRPLEYKDPVITWFGGRYHAYVIGYMRRSERIYHFSSEDGETWAPVGNPYESVMHLDGWHTFFVRPASVVSLPLGHLFFYEGSHTSWYDPVYNVVTGVAFTFDGHHMIDLTPDAPLIASTTPSEHFSTWRYSHWMVVDDELWAYAEVACENGMHEIRRFRAPVPRCGRASPGSRTV